MLKYVVLLSLCILCYKTIDDADDDDDDDDDDDKLQVKGGTKLPEELGFQTLNWICKHHGIYKTRSTGQRRNMQSFAVACPVQITVW